MSENLYLEILRWWNRS